MGNSFTGFAFALIGSGLIFFAMLDSFSTAFLSKGA